MARQPRGGIDSVVPAILLVYACNVVGALAAGGGRAGRAVALALSLLAFALLPAVRPEHATVRGFVWLGACVLFMRMIDIVGEAPRPVARRLAMILLVFDPRDMVPAAPALDLRLVRNGLLFGMLGAVACLVAAIAPVPVRWLAGIVVFYCGLEVVDASFRTVFGVAGRRVLPVQDAPILSRSIGEFWGRRWNREVGAWLSRWCFRPLARRRAGRVGVMLAFVWSALLHAIPAWAAAGIFEAGLMFAFFLVQGVLVLIERPLRVASWPAWAAHTWVIGTFIVSAPMFVEPGLRIFGL